MRASADAKALGEREREARGGITGEISERMQRRTGAGENISPPDETKIVVQEMVKTSK